MVAAVVTAAAVTGGPVLAPLAVGLAVFIMLGALTDIAERAGLGRVRAKVAVARLAGVPRSAYGTAIAHFGVGVCLLGIVCEASWSHEKIAAVKVGDQIVIGTRDLTLERMENRTGPNYRSRTAVFSIRHDGVSEGTIEASRRIFSSRQMATTEAGIRTFGFSQLYVSLGDPMADGGIVVRVWWKPWILCIWYGTLVMMAGGVVSLSDRRLRVGAPKRAKVAAKAPLEAAE